MNVSFDRLIKGVAGAIIIFLLLITVSRWWGDYRVQSIQTQAAETTVGPGTAAATGGEGQKTPSKPASGGKQKTAESSTKKETVVVLIEGLNFREKADRGSRAIRALPKGEKLTLLKTIDSWYQVQDNDGETGWVSSNPSYSKVEK